MVASPDVAVVTAVVTSEVALGSSESSVVKPAGFGGLLVAGSLVGSGPEVEALVALVALVSEEGEDDDEEAALVAVSSAVVPGLPGPQAQAISVMVRRRWGDT